jgi:glucose/arabinose dehydrogenase
MDRPKTKDRRPNGSRFFGRRSLVFGRLSCLLLILSALAACAGGAPARLAARDPEIPFALELPDGYKITLYAKGLEEVRKVVFGPAGTPYVTVMNRGHKRGGKVLALPDTNGDGRADRSVVVVDKLDRPDGIQFHDRQLYVSDPSAIYRLSDTNGDLVADTTQAVVQGIPAHEDHWARPFLFDQAGDIVVAVGSTCNACHEGNKLRGTILRYKLSGGDPAKREVTMVARGLRSVVGLAWRPETQELWATNNGPDHLGPTLPPDQLFHIEEGKHYGWPYCYGDRIVDQTVLNDPKVFAPGDMPKGEFCRTQATSPALLLPPHSAPLGLAFYDGTQFPEAVRGSLFVAYHGAFDFANLNGYRVVRIPFENGAPGQPEDFLTGFVPPGSAKWVGRPVDVAVAPDGSLFVTDDFNGFLYRIEYVGA